MGPPAPKKLKGNEDEAEPVETHESGFVAPLAMFSNFPVNNTFVQMREQQVLAHPIDPISDTYTFTYKGNPYGVLKLSDAKFHAVLQLQSTAHPPVNPAQNHDVPYPNPLRTMWGKKSVWLNNTIVSNSSHAEHIIAYLKKLR